MPPLEKENHLQKCLENKMIHDPIIATRVSMEVSNWLVSWFITYLQVLQPTYIGVIIHLLGTMDIPVLNMKQ